MACLTNYTVQCVDVTSGKTGCFLFDIQHWQQTGEFKAISPVMPDLVAFYAWDRDHGNRGSSCYVERDVVPISRPGLYMTRKGELVRIVRMVPSKEVPHVAMWSGWIARTQSNGGTHKQWSDCWHHSGIFGGLTEGSTRAFDVVAYVDASV